MKPSERNALWALGVCSALTAGLYWLLDIHFGWDVWWWIYAIVWAGSVGTTWHRLNETDAMQKLADRE